MKLGTQTLLVAGCITGVCQGQVGGSASAVGSTTSTTTQSSTSSVASASSSPLVYGVNVPNYLAQLPPCGAKCVNISLSASKCSGSGASSCICSDETFSEEVAKCARASCDFAQQLLTRNTTEGSCGRPPRDRSGQYNGTSIALCAVTGSLVIMRLIFKLWFSYHKSLRSDDWVILLSVLVGLPCTILNTVGLTHNGLGKDVWTMHPSEIVEFARYFFIQQILYIFLMTSIKLSLLCFYLTIFPGKKTRLVLWLTVAMNIMFGIIFTTISVFQCTPVRFYWMQYVQESDGQCININLTGWLNGAVSVVIDLWMIGIPLFQIKKLELHWKKKVGAAVMFLTGAFVTVVSILRLQSLLYFYSSLNPTWDLWHTAWWSTIEINIGLICACLPTIRLLLVRMWPRVFGSTINSTMARSRASRGNSMMVRRQQVRIASLEIQLDEAPPNSKEEHWQPSPTGNQQHWEASSTGAEEQWDEHFYHAK